MKIFEEEQLRAGSCTSELQLKGNCRLKVNCGKKFGLVCQLLTEPAQILSYYLLLVYNSLQSVLLYMIRAFIFQIFFIVYLYSKIIQTHLKVYKVFMKCSMSEENVADPKILLVCTKLHMSISNNLLLRILNSIKMSLPVLVQWCGRKISRRFNGVLPFPAQNDTQFSISLIIVPIYHNPHYIIWACSKLFLWF